MSKLNHINLPLLLVAFLFSTTSYSALISINNLCSDTVYLESYIDLDGPKTVGELTHTFFLLNPTLSRTVTDDSVIQILNTPIGVDGYEIISDEEMYVYGWCYDVNGKFPEELMSTFKVSNSDTITWSYGFSHYLKGKWLTYCTPAYTRQWSKICK